MVLEANSPKLPGPVGSGIHSVIGAILEIIHACSAIGDAFDGCSGAADCLQRLGNLDDVQVLGLIVCIRMLVVSVTVLMFSARAVYFRYNAEPAEGGGGTSPLD